MKDLENEAASLRRQLDFAAEKVRKQEENSQETQVVYWDSEPSVFVIFHRCLRIAFILVAQT